MGWAICMKHQGDLDGAMAKYEQALKIQTQVFGENHSDVGSTLGNMANVLSAQHRSDEALAMYEKSLAVKIRSLGAEVRIYIFLSTLPRVDSKVLLG